MDNNNFIPNTMVSSDSHSENASFVAMKTVNQMMPPVALYSSEIPFSAEAAMMNTGGYQHMDYTHTSNNNMMINNNSNHFMNYNQPHITTTPVVKSHHNTATYSSPPTQNGYLQQQQQQIPQTGYLPMDSTTHTMMNNLNSMDIDDYFTPTNMDSMFAANNIYSPSTNSVTTNSSVIMMDTMSPSSPTHMLSPNNTTNNLNHHLMSPAQSMDTTFVSPVGTPYHHLLITDNLQQHDSNTMYPEAPIVPTNIGMSHHHYNQPNTMMYNNNGNDDMMLLHHHTTIQQQQPYFDRKGRRPLPRRHTVSTPYATTNMMITNNSNTSNKGKESEQQQQQQQQPHQPVTKSRKSSLKAKRHRSLGKLDIFATSTSSPPPIPDLSTSTAFEPLSAKLELWTHEQLLERVMELEKEKETVVQTTNTNKLNEVTQDEGGESKASKVAANKTRSASQTDTELEEEEEEEDEEGSHICKWDNCSIEFKSLDDLINHVKVDHIGSGKANYYCCWKNCARQQKPFTKRHKMHNHLRTHTGERPFVCLEPDCGKKFSRPDSLTTHAKIHSNIRPYLCNNIDCGKAYYHLRSLRKHERTHLQKDITATTPPPPLPVVVMSNVTQQHTTTIHPDDHHDIVVQQGEEVYSDWGLSAQAAVFNIMDRENSSFM